LSGETVSALSSGGSSFFNRFPSGGGLGLSADSRFLALGLAGAGKLECCGDFRTGAAKTASPSPSTVKPS
jgi:hypothetical protein